MGLNIAEEIDCGNLFDQIDDLTDSQIDDLMDFPLDDNECGGGGGGGAGDDDGKLVSSIEGQGFPTWNDALQDCDPFLSSGHVNSASGLSAELSVPYEDIVQLEWLSTFVEDSFSSIGLTLGKNNHLCTKKEPSGNQFQTSSPLSVLESTTTSSSSSSGGKTMPPLGPQRARSKRPRPATFNPRPAIQLTSHSSSSVGNTPPPFCGFPLEPNSFAESPPIKKKIRVSPATNKIRKIQRGEEEYKKNKKIRMTFPADAPPVPHDGSPVQKCLHCGITKTPQWRGGPLGPKTLCNACGVRYKSGRLFPEYRPAASPTFVPSLHSNSHKKVVEMRSKVGPGNAGGAQNQAKDPDVVPNA